MCGIAGVVCWTGGPPDAEALRRMAGALRHRGPDEFGLYRDRAAGLAAARLSIVDLATGQQPLANEDGTLWIAFNGEVFNYPELREALAARGHRFRTRSDTEVIVHAYEAWGEAAFERMNGQFAVALWDAARRALVLARDRFGIHPLYLCERGGRILFASTVRALFAGDASIPRALEPEGLDDTFTFWSVIAPRSVFRAVAELPPGCVRTYGGGDSRGAAGGAPAVRELRFGAPRFPAEHRGLGASGARPDRSLDEAARAVRRALQEAVRLRVVRADVPVGCYVSGGLDSSLVAALGLGLTGDRFRTFSLRFEDAEYDETEFQRALVARLGSDHAEVVVTRRAIADAFPDVVAHAERPVLRAAPAPLFLLSRLVRDSGIKVVLTGEGADEVFAGYDLFREAKVRRFWAREPASERRPRLLERLYPYLARSPVSERAMARAFFGRDLAAWREPGFSHAPRWRPTAALKRLFSSDLRGALAGRDAPAEFLATLPTEFSSWSFLAQDQHLEIVTLLSPYLLASQGDRMLMAHSVEGRYPYLDPEVVALAEGLPPEQKLRVLDEKHVLKRAADGLLPDAILRRKKQPYRAPDAASFVGPDAPEWVAEAVSPRALRDGGVFDADAVLRLWTKCRARRDAGAFSNADNMAVVGVLSTQLLHAGLVARPPADPGPVVFKTLVDRVET